ncbi:hypothetical protein HZC31_08255 [Candidatus Woesearchaeota archaeon]|nr:hypothetical protein [Candidatus Woesearchaeota archaeon]
MEQEKTETTAFYKNKKIQVLFLLLIMGFLLYKTIDYFGAIGYRETWTICSDYFHEGTLWTGQPRCEGAILPFYILAFLDTLVGREYVQIAAIVFSTIISAIFLWVFLKAVRKEIDEKEFFLPAVLFGLFFYINTIINIETVLNSFFFFLGYYTLFHTEWKWKYSITGIFLFAAMISKINVIVQIAFLLFWYTYEKKVWSIENKKLKVQSNELMQITKNYIAILLPIILGFVILTKVYKYFWIYSWSVFTNQNIALSIPQTLKELILFDITKADINYIPVLLIAILGTYLFLKERKIYALLSGPAFLIAIFLIARAFGILFVTGLRYWSVIFPFAIIMLLRVRQIWTTPPKKQIMQGLMLILLLYPGLYYGPLLFKDDLSYLDSLNFIDRATEGWQEKDAIIKQINYGYSVVPEQEGRILLEDDPAGFRRTIISFGSNIPYEKIDFLTKKYMESHPDVWGFPRYQELLGENMIYNPTSSELNEKEKEVIEKIEGGTYSLIIFGPPEWAITERILSNVNNGTIQKYCQIVVPNNVWLTDDGWHFSYFMFQNYQDCQEMLEKMYIYFSQNYQEICTKDKETANMITTVLRQNGLAFDKMCVEGGDSLEFFKKGYATKKVELMAMVVLLFLPLLWYGRKIKEDKEMSEEEKRHYYILIIIGVIAFIGFWLGMDATLPYKSGIVQAITG